MGLGGGAVSHLMGGSAPRHPDRYAVGDPARLLPLGVPQVLVHGDADGAVPLALSRHYVEQAVVAGDRRHARGAGRWAINSTSGADRSRLRRLDGDSPPPAPVPRLNAGSSPECRLVA